MPFGFATRLAEDGTCASSESGGGAFVDSDGCGDGASGSDGAKCGLVVHKRGLDYEEGRMYTIGVTVAAVTVDCEIPR